jgi:sugar/nucleoside kinase (ribokinase family)
MRHFSAPQVEECNDTGAGDIFATAFFYRHFQTKNPWEAARFATQLAAISVTRTGLDSVPTVDEIKNQTIEIL